MSRMSNASARHEVNAWLDRNGHERLPEGITYVEAATRFRAIWCKSNFNFPPFPGRAEAAAFLRLAGRQFRRNAA